MEARLTEILQEKFQTGLEQATNEQVYYALLTLTKERIKEGPKNEGKRKLYYISAEFLIGKLLSNNLINLGIYDETAEVLKKHGKKLAEIEEVEPEPSLGNGGLGRLAACFLDSIATLGLPGDGIGLNYHMGLFKQVFTDHKQDEQKNPWIEKDSWLNDTGISFEVPFKDFSLRSHLYDIDVTGYEGGSNKLHLFDVETVNDAIVGNGINFDKNDIRENLTLFLYPDDSDKAGNLLRIYQQYFMVSNAAQYIIRECEEKGYDLRKLHEHVAIQINDTHPSMVIPELIRLLVQKQRLRSYRRPAHIPITPSSQKHWKNGRLIIWSRLHHRSFRSSVIWMQELREDIKIRESILSMTRIVYTWLIWTSIMDTVSTELLIFIQRS